LASAVRTGQRWPTVSETSEKGQTGDWNPNCAHQTSGMRRITVVNLRLDPFPFLTALEMIQTDEAEQ
jgi:hypothetical protein